MSKSRPVQRLDADRHWLMMVVSFGVSVVGTRVYLEATGYPQIGNGTLHIAHVLWGGLLLFAALGVFLTFGNSWSYPVSALLGGAGVGLFIDEIGKFITQNNDYFFPFAAPIIYAFFLLIAFLYLQLRRLRPHSTRADLYQVLDKLKDMVDQDFDINERTQVEAILSRVMAETDQPHRKQVAEALLTLIQSIPAIPPPDPHPFQRLIALLKLTESRYISRMVLRSLLFAAFLLSSFGGLVVLLALVGISTDAQVRDEFIGAVITETSLTGVLSLQWLLIQIILTGIMGLLYLLAGLLLVRWESAGMRVGRFALLLELTVVNILAFYFSQFAMVFSTLVALAVLFAVERYRARFLRRTG